VAAAQQAWVDGWISSMWIDADMATAAFVYLLVGGPRKPPATDAATEGQRTASAVGGGHT